MLISYEPMSDVLSITFSAAPVAQSQVQGTVAVSYDATGSAVAVSIPEASSLLWEKGGQVNVLLPEKQTVVVTEQVVDHQPRIG